MNILGERIIKQLPNSLKHFKLVLSKNNLGGNVANMKYLCDGLKCLPKNLQKLILFLGSNNFGDNFENMKHLGDCLKQ